MSAEDYRKILINNHIYSGNDKSTLDPSELRSTLIKIKDFYLKNLNLYNSYKHGYRIFPLTTLDEFANSTSIIMYLPKNYKENQASLIRLPSVPDEYLEIAMLISTTLRQLYGNLESKLRDENEFDVSIQAKISNQMNNKGPDP